MVPLRDRSPVIGVQKSIAQGAARGVKRRATGCRGAIVGPWVHAYMRGRAKPPVKDAVQCF